MPSLAWIGQFLYFLRFLKTKSAVLSGRRDIIIDDVNRAYLQNDSGVARNLHAKFGADLTVSEFSTIF
jgi:hypothetical protein